MATKYIVSVTEDDIRAGVGWNCSLCPVALALKRATGAAKVIVDSSFLSIERTVSEGLWEEWSTPRDIGDWIIDFDGGRSVKPFQFELEEGTISSINPHNRQDM